ncbi:ankyrin repeat domain-containing protein [Campylobacter sp. FMV-PI01]|uniref:Ankyrin repeat domain-containing protein n=2 Tax=Campylobacter portucalensis TaxID=2608384 RepID=A0A6L5WIE1_9BACT|nr:ankyrin repeat domain-containing protein [Campylobacter portucalensis]
MLFFILSIILPASFLSAGEVCQILKDDPNYFLNKQDYEDLEFLNDEMICEADFLQNLNEIALKIRGLNVDCDGSMAFFLKKEFKRKILKALYLPEIYKKSLKDTDFSDEISSRNFLQSWSLKSLDNYIAYQKFNSAYNTSFQSLVNFYKKIYDEASAVFLAKKVANEFLKFAGGDKINFKMDEFEDILSSKYLDEKMLIEYIYEHKNLNLNKALKISILKKRNFDFINYILDLGAVINEGHESALFYALKDLNMVKFLLKKGADINYKNSFGKTVLFYAVEFKDKDLVKFLITNKADVNAKIISNYEKSSINSSNLKFCALNHTSKSVLMHAAKYSNLEIVKILIQNGAKIDESDDMGYNLADWAWQNKDKYVFLYVENLGIKKNKFKGEYDE